MRNLLRSVAILLAVWALPLPAAPALDPAANLVFDGNVSDGQRTDGLLWFDLAGVDARFALDPRRTKDAERIFRALRSSVALGQSVAVTVDLRDAVLDPALQRPVFVVRQLQYEGSRYSGTKPGWSPPVGEGATVDAATQRRVIEAIALRERGRYADIVAALDPVAARPDLPPQLARLVFRNRSYALQNDIESRNYEFSPADDAQLVRALEDARRWAALDPDNERAALQVGAVLVLLGGYEDAMAHFQAMHARAPEQSFWSLIRLAGVQRLLGRNDEALDTLAVLGRNLGDIKAMPYHYHRAWTLNKMGRYAEAIDEIDAGLRLQPDYPGAFWRRACSYAALGKIDAAMADLERAARMLEPWQGERASPAAISDEKLRKEMMQALREAAARPAPAPTDAACRATWYEGRRRERSALLASGDAT